MKKSHVKQSNLIIKRYSLYILIALLVAGSVFGVSTIPSVRALFGGAKGGGPVSNAGHSVRQPASVAGNNLTAYFPLDGSAANAVTTLADVNNNDLTPQGTGDGSAGGRYGNAFKGTVAGNNGLQSDDTASLSMSSSTSFTLAGWFYPNAESSWNTLFCKGNANSGTTVEYYVYRNSDDTLTFTIGNGSSSQGMTSAATVPLNAWSFVAARYDKANNQMLLQINSTAETPVSYSTGSQDTTGTFTVGRDCGVSSGYWNGYVDEVGLWKRSLSDTEITTLRTGAGLNYALVPESMKTSLSSWWNMDEASGTRQDNHKTVSTDGTVNGNAAPTTGKFGQAYTFDGTGDYINTTYAGVSGSGARSISFWVYYTAGTNSYIMGYGDNSATYKRFDLSINSGTFWLLVNGFNRSWSSAVTGGQWTHIVFVYPSGAVLDSTAVTLYVNGVDFGEGSTSGTSALNTATGTTVKIGADSSAGSYFSGKIDDFRFYDVELNATQALQLYGASSPSSCDQSCIGWWKMDEATGTSAVDSSGKGNTSTYTGSPTLNSEGIFSGAMKLDATAGKYLDVGTANALNLTSNYYTLSAWVKFSSVSGTQWLIARDQAGSRGFAWGFISGKQTLSIAGSGSSGVGSTLSAGTWYHVVLTSVRPSLTTNKYYLNGLLDHTASGASAIPNVTGVSTSVGERKYSGFEQAFNGSIDDVRMYDRALEPHEVYELYLAGRQ